ncbi:tetratricopeptide repeat protein [Streptomyces sp. NPDC021608]|uniref:tetratricopeptide repeat protein n=1 Tax=Streptomyces sp. NPDC021608 TaxID=3154903 RepID=UPI0033E07916
MSRLSREKKREQQHPGGAAAVAAPLDVHVRGGGTATIGGVPVASADGEEIQRAVLGHLHRIALATGHPVLASVRDERIGYVVPLRVEPDGSSHFTAEPLRTPVAPPAAAQTTPADAPPAPAPVAPPVAPPAPAAVVSSAAVAADGLAVSAPAAPAASTAGPASGGTWDPGADGRGVHPEATATASCGDHRPTALRRDEPTHLLRQVAEPVRDAVPTFPLRAVPEPGPFPAPTTDSPASATPDVQDEVPSLGTVAAPTGVFGPPPAMDERPHPDATPEATLAPAPSRATAPPPDVFAPTPLPLPVPGPAAVPTAAPASHSTSATTPAAAPTPFLPDGLVSEPDPDFRPTPARGFDAVAEAVLGDDPRTPHGAGAAPALLGEPMAQINEAVRAGRTDVAAGLAERTVLEASATLGPEHPEVLRLRELMAYIAYLGGDPLRSFHVSLDLARIGRRAGDAEAAYGNVQSAATAWRAVRDPLQGLNLGNELLGLWTELAAEEGPAADDVEELESARARMLRLAARARKAGA